MHKIWLMFEPRQALTGLLGFLFVLALLIHFFLLTASDYFDFLQGPEIAPEAAAQMIFLPAGR